MLKSHRAGPDAAGRCQGLDLTALSCQSLNTKQAWFELLEASSVQVPHLDAATSGGIVAITQLAFTDSLI